MSRGSISTRAIVLKRKNIGETDRLITILTQEFGRITVVAKGARKVTSSRTGHLEPGNVVETFLIKTKSLPILTQTKPIDCCPTTSYSLKQLRAISQVLEMVHVLFIEEEIPQVLFEKVEQLVTDVKSSMHHTKVRHHLADLVAELGYGQPESADMTLTEFVESITDRKVKSWGYLSV